MVFSGVFDRHRQLKAVAVENDAGWAARMLEGMDFRYERGRFWAGPSNSSTSAPCPVSSFASTSIAHSCVIALRFATATIRGRTT
jgi:hypothetical protein